MENDIASVSIQIKEEEQFLWIYSQGTRMKWIRTVSAPSVFA